jgi:glycosyltransferase involved in cell wall biosynthesis
MVPVGAALLNFLVATVRGAGFAEIRLALAPRFGVRKALHAHAPEIVHIATEGPIGWSARAWCLAHDVPFTSAFHTRFPDYVAARTPLSPDLIWPIMRKFHSPSRAVLTATQSLRNELAVRGIAKTAIWSRGIDRDLFHRNQPAHPALAQLKKPILLSVGRVAVEKNLQAFLSADTDGTKVIVGDGPARAALAAQYPDAIFMGTRKGAELASIYASADVFVFPSKTDTFGLVILEALACGVPVAAYPVQGPLDIIGLEGLGLSNELPKPVGALNEDLSAAIDTALTLDRNVAADYGAQYCWDKCTEQFLNGLKSAIMSAQPIAA